MILISQIINDATIHLANENTDFVYGAFLIGGAAFTLAAVAIGGAVVKTGISALGVGKKKREAKAKQVKLDAAIADVEDFEFTNAYSGLTGAEYDIQEAKVAALDDPAQLGNAQTMSGKQIAKGFVGDLASAKGYSAGGYEGEGYTGEGYSAQGTNISGLQRGANTGLTNNFNNLQVSTAAAEMQGQETDQALAASQDLAAQAGTGAGGATALAAAAAKSKQGISSTIDQQVKSNEMMRSQGEQELQRAQLAQGNLASQFDIGQSQFNVGAQNQAAQFGAGARNQANQFSAGARNESNRFTADAENQAAKFKAQAQNQFAQSRFSAANDMSKFNAGAKNQVGLANQAAQNQFSMADIASQNQFGLAEYGAQNQANSQNASAQTNANAYQAQSGYDASKTVMGGDESVQNNEYGRDIALLNMAGGQAAAATGALNNQVAQIKGNANGIVDSVGNAITSDRRLKKNIKEIATSVSGYKIYNFEYKDTKHGKGIFQGVMSDEMPEYAIVKNEDGFDAVDYSVIDVEFKNI